jgi:8-oxo-dGTP pyrophosphatase MutT (NUDIX family)
MAGRATHSPIPRPAGPLDRLWQMTYWLLYRAAKTWWFIRQPIHYGALVALWHNDEILILELSYRRTLNLPGGGIEPGEDALTAVVREAEEEIGLVLSPSELTLATSIAFDWENRHDHVTLFEASLREKPVLSIDHREIIAATFRDPAEIRPEDLSPHLRYYLARREASKLEPAGIHAVCKRAAIRAAPPSRLS